MIIFWNCQVTLIPLVKLERSEEEFRLCKIYTTTKYSDINLISSEKLTDFFKDHLKEKPIEIQPEVINPEQYPHILPPE